VQQKKEIIGKAQVKVKTAIIKIIQYLRKIDSGSKKML
jgi:hypothetical protein